MITFTNSKGTEIVLTKDKPFRLIDMQGSGGVEADIQMQKAPFQDGQTFIQSILEPRSISLEIIIFGTDKAHLYECRRKITDVFNPKLGEGVLKFEYPGGVKYINAISESAPVFPTGTDNSTERLQRVLINLICPNPYWRERNQFAQLAVWEGGLEFPLQLPVSFAQLSAHKSKLIYNRGDEETPVNIVFHGPVTAPVRIENETAGYFLEVDQSLSEDEKLEINTAFGSKRVLRVLTDGRKVNAFHYISMQSTFFQLQPGNNKISYSTGEEYERAAVELSWSNRYLGI